MMSKKFDVYKWRRDNLLTENLEKYQKCSKDKIGQFEQVYLPKKQTGTGVELIKTPDINFNLIPNEVMYVGEQNAIPVFLFDWSDSEHKNVKPTDGLTSDEYNKNARGYQGD